MADEDYRDSDAQMYENFFYRAGFALYSNEVTKKNQNSKPNYHTESCSIV
jgi:hypothetical protein